MTVLEPKKLKIVKLVTLVREVESKRIHYFKKKHSVRHVKDMESWLASHVLRGMEKDWLRKKRFIR